MNDEDANVVNELIDALYWALDKDPSPCRCIDFATPPHVCTAHRAIARATEAIARPLPSLAPSLLFTEDEVKSVDWDAVFADW